MDDAEFFYQSRLTGIGLLHVLIRSVECSENPSPLFMIYRSMHAFKNCTGDRGAIARITSLIWKFADLQKPP